MRTRSFCLLAAVVLFALFALTLQAPSVAAASTGVTQPVTCTMGSSGTQATITFSNSSASSTWPQVLCDGSSHNIVLSAGATYTVQDQSASSPVRYRFYDGSTGGTTSESLNACTTVGSTCSAYSITNYYELNLQVYYTLSGGGSPSAPQFVCKSTGVASSTVLTTSSTGFWADDGCSWSVTPNPLSGSGSSERWDTQGTTSGVVSGVQTTDPTFYHQYAVTLSYSVSGGGGIVSPTLTSSQFGSSTTATLTTSPLAYWLDASSAWSVSNPTSGSTSTERWEAAGTGSGTVSGSSAVVVTYYHQYGISFSYSLSGGGTGGSAPSLSYTALGASGQVTLGTAAGQVWLDAGSTWTATSPLTGSTSTERWGVKANTGTASSAAAVALSYYHQYLLTATYSLTGGGSGYTSPSATFKSFGAISPVSLSQGTFWVDSGSSWSVDNPLTGSTSQERWSTNATSSGTMSSSLTLTFAYFHQYFVTISYSVVGGGSGYGAPSATVSQFGSRVSALSGWADAGKAFSLTNPLNGSSAGERWYTGSGQGTVSSALTVQATYYHQFDLVMSYAVVGTASQVPPPTLNSTALGQGFISNLQTAPADHWLDSGAAWTVGAQLPGSGASERWMTDQPTSGTALVGSTSVVTFYEQYAAGFDYTSAGGNPPSPPSLNYSSFSATHAAPLNSSRVVYWLNSGSNWSLTNPIPGKNAFERWLADKAASGTAMASFNESLLYTHQYYLSLVPNVKDGGTIEVPSDWHDSGASISLNVTASAGWKFFGWEGQGSGSYTGSSPEQSVTLGSSVNETAVFYAGLSMSAGSGGSVSYRYGGTNGTVSPGGDATIYLNPGTRVNLTATPSTVAYVFSGWSGKLAGTDVNRTLTVASPATVSATFGLDYTDIGAFYAVTVVVMVAAAFVFVVRRRHQVFRSGQLTPPTS